ncbi:MAG: (5-formylfuran-3-yl)methyl phosphate synthase [Candidatus Lokiarchaeota archaeon]|nr:(5-formylfuran-3-yl)methyl phosphate synthase [Candidatus Lokiarchaeota archaeon]
MKLLISPKTIEEAKIVVRANVDFIDCKNPEEGSLGANFPWIIKAMKDIIPKNSSQLLSATIGDFPNLPGSASLAALGAVVSGADIIKVGLKGPKNIKEGIKLMKAVVKAVKTYKGEIMVVTAGYGDFTRIDNGLDFLSIPTIAAESGADIAMLDTYIKDKKGLFDFLTVNQLIEFKEKSNQLGLKIALAGNLNKDVLSNIRKINPDIIGVRSMVCDGYDRNKGNIRLDFIDDLKSHLYT